MVSLITPVFQNWLMALSDNMKETLQLILKKYIKTTDHNPDQFPSQVGDHHIIKVKTDYESG